MVSYSTKTAISYNPHLHVEMVSLMCKTGMLLRSYLGFGLGIDLMLWLELAV